MCVRACVFERVAYCVCNMKCVCVRECVCVYKNVATDEKEQCVIHVILSCGWKTVLLTACWPWGTGGGVGCDGAEID